MSCLLYSVLPWNGSRLVQVPTSTRISLPSTEVCCTCRSRVTLFSLVYLVGDYLYFFVIVQLFWFYVQDINFVRLKAELITPIATYQTSRSPDSRDFLRIPNLGTPANCEKNSFSVSVSLCPCLSVCLSLIILYRCHRQCSPSGYTFVAIGPLLLLLLLLVLYSSTRYCSGFLNTDMKLLAL